MMLLTDARALDPVTFQTESEPVLVGWVRELYGAGWQPTELIRFVQLRGKSRDADLIRQAIAAERAPRTGPTTSNPGWRNQWDAAGLLAQSPSARWVAAWADTVPEGQWLRQILRLAFLLGGAPRLDVLLPPPPGVRSSPPLPGRTVGAADPVRQRVRALLAMAESTDHELEATAFTAKAQELMTKHTIDLATVESEAAAPGMPHLIRIPIDAPYADARALLLQTVAERSRCRAIHMSPVGMSTVVGYPTDLEAVEMLFTSLLVQAQHALSAASAAGFCGRIQKRLEEVNRLVYADADADAALPVLRSHDARIDEFMEQHFTETHNMEVRGGSDGLGYAHGELAGDKAALTSGSVEDGPRDEEPGHEGRDGEGRVDEAADDLVDNAGGEQETLW